MEARCSCAQTHGPRAAEGRYVEGMIDPDSLTKFRRWKGLDADEALPAE
jgi:hypothetical protein